MRVKPPATIAGILLFVFIPFMATYLLSELFRNINAVVGPVIRRELGFGVEYLGFLTSVFLFAIAGAQIFTGIWLDRFGPRNTVAALLCVGAIGAVLFSTATGFGLLCGRFLIGVGMAGCWTAAFMVNSRWLPPKRLALANAAAVGCAGMGALFSTLPVQLILQRISWNELFLWLAAVTLVAAALLMLIVPSHPDDSARDKHANFAHQLRGFSAVLRNPAFIRFAPISALGQGVWIAYQGLWAGVWLREVDGLADIPVAAILLALAFAVVIGNLCLGGIADVLVRAGVSVARTMIATGFLFIGVQIIIALNLGEYFGEYMVFLWSAFGLLTGSSLFAYALIANAVAPDLTGRAMSLLNLIATLCAFLMQYGVGVIVEFWQASATGAYPAAAHQTAFGVIIILQVIGFLWLVGFPSLQKTKQV